MMIPLSNDAFGQVIETKGQNYDLIENYNIGEATWTSNAERIMDNDWKNYVLTNNNEKVIFNSNAVGSLVFDKSSCSYSIYENGFDGANVIPSVSAVATFESNNVWSNLAVNDESCLVDVIQYEKGVFLTSTKVVTQDTTEDIFISYTGSDELFYANATTAQFTLLQYDNGTNRGYFNGEVTVTEGTMVEKFVQQLDLNIDKGFKETFKVWNQGEEPLGISQTVHTGESITIGDTTINIAELNGQSFDKQYIVDNQAEILQITDSLNYEFTTGISSLTNVNIIFDGDYKVNLDYASGVFPTNPDGYKILIIDPTFTFAQSSSAFALGSFTEPNYIVSSAVIGSSALSSTQLTSLTSAISSGASSWSSPISNNFIVTTGGSLSETLVVAGGGGGGSSYGGGGGAGGYKEGGAFTVSAQTYAVTIGAGGASGQVDSAGTGTVGGNSAFDSITSNGGGGGRTYWSASSNGGSGGGGSLTNSGGDSAGTGIGGQGNNGANGSGYGGYNGNGGGGGGGAGGAGSGITGGAGTANDITGSSLYYAGGGGGSRVGISGAGGSSIGGSGGEGAQASSISGGVVDTGSGGGGGNVANDGGSDGIVIVRYTSASGIVATGGAVSNVGSDTVHKFTTIDTTASLVMTYVITTVPTASPTSLTTTTGIPIVLDWTGVASGDNGGSAITGYKVFRTTEQFTQVELPNSSGSDAGITFTDNELLIHGFDTVKNSSLDGTNNGATTGVTGQVSNAWSFDGSNDKVVLGSASDWKFLSDATSNTWSIAWWQIYDDTLENGHTIMSTTDGSTQTDGMFIDNSGSGDIRLIQVDGNNGSWSNAIPDNTSFHHYAITWNAGTTTLYVDGVSKGTQSQTSGSGTPQYALNLGANNDEYYTELTLDQLLIYNDVLSASEVSALHSSGTIPTDNLFAHYDFEQTGSTLENQGVEKVLNDKSTNSITVTKTAGTDITGNIISAIQSPNLSYSNTNLPDNTDTLSVGGFVKIDLPKDTTQDGTNNGATTGATGKVGDAWDFTTTDSVYVSIPSPSPNTNSATTKWTLNTWVNLQSSSHEAFLTTGTSSSDRIDFRYHQGNDDFGYLEYGNAGSSGSYDIVNGAYDTTTNGWYMVTYVRDGLGWTHYFNGVASGTHTATASTLPSDSIADGTWKIGQGGYTPESWTGEIDEMSFWSEALTQADVTALYASTNGIAFTDATFPEKSNIIAHYDFEQTGSTLENQGTSAPTNTKLLGLNDVSFNVSATTANISELVSGGTVGQINQAQDTTCGLERYDENHTCGQKFGTGATLNGITIEGVKWQLYKTTAGASGTLHAYVVNDSWTRDKPASSILYDMGSMAISSITEVCSSGSATCNNGVEYAEYTFTGSGTYTLGSSGSTEYVIIHADHNNSGFYVGMPNLSSSSYDGTDSAKMSKWGTQAINVNSSQDLDLKFIGIAESTIISATSLTDSSSTAQHYSFTRGDGGANVFKIYQNGVLKSTATDSTSLGSNLATTTITQSSSNEWTVVSSGGSAISECSGEVFTTNSALNGDIMTSFTLDVSGTGGRTGDLLMGVFDESNCDVRTTFRTIDASTINSGYPSTFDTYTATGSHVISNGDLVGLKWINGNNGNISYKSQNTDVYDTGAGITYNQEKGYKMDGVTNSANRDAKFIITTGTPSSYTTNLSGSLDEFFINSDTLTIAEISHIYNRGIALTELASTNSATTAYTDSSVVGGTQYYYSSVATNSVGQSAYLTPFVAGLAGTPPDAPTSISATIANTATAPLDVTVTWSSPTNVGSGTLSNFQIFRDGVSQGTVGLVTTFADTVPSTGTFAYTVKAISNHGTSVSSSADSITTPSLPSQPTLTLTTLSDTSMKLDWTASSENGSTLQGYKIEYSLDNTNWLNIIENTGNVALTRTVTSMNVDDQYYLKVSGINGVGIGTPSATKNAWTLLSAPTNLVATAMAVDQIDLAWSGIGGISSYTIQYEYPTGNGFTNLATGVSSGDTTYTSDSLTTGTQYNYRIFGVSSNSGLNSVASNEDSANTFGILPAPVLNTLTSITVNPASVQLDYTASAGNPLATGYKIERNLGSGWIVINSDTGSTSTTYLDEASGPLNDPQYRVSAINAYGVSPSSNELTLTVASSGGGSGGGGGGGSSKKIVSAIDELLNLSILGNTHVMSNGEFLTGKIPISWDSGENLRISAVDYDDSILDSIQFNIEETTPIILQGSGNSFSSDDITYTISTPTQICNLLTSDPSKKISTNCLEEKLYELPITVTATSVGDNISQTTLITIDTRSGFGGDTLALLSIFIMVIIAGIGIIKFARKSGGSKRNHSTNGRKKAPKTTTKPRKSIK